MPLHPDRLRELVVELLSKPGHEQRPPIVLADSTIGASMVWAMPGAMWEFGVSHPGDFILWRAENGSETFSE